MFNNSLYSRGWQSRILLLIISVGLVIQVSGKVFFESGSARNSQVYIWLLLPGLIFLGLSFFKKTELTFRVDYLPWLIFLSWVALSTTWATDPEGSPCALAKRGVFIVFYFSAVFLLFCRDERLLRRALMVSVVVVALGALLSLIYQYGIVGKSFAYRAYRIDRMGIGNFANYGYPVASGIFHGAVAVWALGFALDNAQAKLKHLLFWLCVFLILGSYAYLTYTRGAWFALLGGFFAVVIFQRTKLAWWLLGIAIISAACVFWVLWSKILLEFNTRELSGRGQIWRYFFDVMSGHWIIGYGLGTEFLYIWPDGKRTSPHAHSLYLQQIYDSGLVAIAFFIAGLSMVFYKIWMARDNYWVRLAAPALCYALIAMLTDVERLYTRPGDYWTLFWLPLIIVLSATSSLPFKRKRDGA